MVQFLSIIFFIGFLQFLLGFSKVPVFCVTCIWDFITTTNPLKGNTIIGNYIPVQFAPDIRRISRISGLHPLVLLSDKDESGGLEEGYWLGKTEVLGKKSNPVQICTPQDWQGPSWNRIWDSEVRNHQLKLDIYLRSILQKSCLYPSEKPV